MHFDCLKPRFPVFHRRLNAGTFDPIEAVFIEPAAPISPEELDYIASFLPAPLPGAYREFMLCLGGYRLHIRNTIPLTFWRPMFFEDLPGHIRIADYFLEADGDSVFFDVSGGMLENDYPVYYYAHGFMPDEKRAFRKLADSFAAWIESL